MHICMGPSVGVHAYMCGALSGCAYIHVWGPQWACIHACVGPQWACIHTCVGPSVGVHAYMCEALSVRACSGCVCGGGGSSVGVHATCVRGGVGGGSSGGVHAYVRVCGGGDFSTGVHACRCAGVFLSERTCVCWVWWWGGAVC